MHFPACSLSSHVRMCTCLRLRAILVCRPASRVYVSVCVRVYVFQESQWLDSVSLLIKDTLEGEMLMIDNLSGSVFHHYSSPPPICKDCKGHPQEVPPWLHMNTHAVHTPLTPRAITPRVKFILWLKFPELVSTVWCPYRTVDDCIHFIWALLVTGSSYWALQN